MLLHVIKAAWPVDAGLDFARVERLGQRVPHHAIFYLNVDYRYVVQHAGIGWSPATFRVECATVKRDT